MGSFADTLLICSNDGVYMIDTIANVFLSLTHTPVIIPLIILGYIWIDHDTFYHATCLTLISMMFNFALKVTFQVPLSPTLGKEGFAFPSGHMQLATILYGWLAFKSNSLVIRIIVAILLIGIGLSLVYFQYHDYYDVFAAVFFALLAMVVYYQVITKAKRISAWIVIAACSILMLYIYLRFEPMSSHVWMAYYTLIGFMASDKIFYHQISSRRSVLEKIIRSVICLASVFGIVFLFSNEMFLKLPMMINNLQWLLVGFIIPCLGQGTWRHTKLG